MPFWPPYYEHLLFQHILVIPLVASVCWVVHLPRLSEIDCIAFMKKLFPARWSISISPGRCRTFSTLPYPYSEPLPQGAHPTDESDRSGFARDYDHFSNEQLRYQTSIPTEYSSTLGKFGKTKKLFSKHSPIASIHWVVCRRNNAANFLEIRNNRRAQSRGPNVTAETRPTEI